MTPCTTHLVPIWSYTYANPMAPEGSAVTLSSFSRFRCHHKAGGPNAREQLSVLQAFQVTGRLGSLGSLCNQSLFVLFGSTLDLSGSAVATSSIFLNYEDKKKRRV